MSLKRVLQLAHEVRLGQSRSWMEPHHFSAAGGGREANFELTLEFFTTLYVIQREGGGTSEPGSCNIFPFRSRNRNRVNIMQHSYITSIEGLTFRFARYS
jgi:hypothetical protein